MAAVSFDGRFIGFRGSLAGAATGEGSPFEDSGNKAMGSAWRAFLLDQIQNIVKLLKLANK
jgi:hypothetical protein